MYKKAISTEHIQNIGFKILQKYIKKKAKTIIFVK